MKYYRLQCLFHMPQLRMLDGVEITNEEKVKGENLHGYDLQDREIIFKSLLPEEKFVDRRISTIDDVVQESDSDGDYPNTNHSRIDENSNTNHQVSESPHDSKHSVNTKMANSMARQYVGEMISRVDFTNKEAPKFIQDNT